MRHRAARLLCVATAAAVPLLAAAGESPAPLAAPPQRPTFSSLSEKASRAERHFKDLAPGPAKLRLRTTPHEGLPPHEPTQAGLARLCFLCNRCGAVIAPAGSVWRTTVSPTPIMTSADHSQLTGMQEDVQDSVFASEAAAAHVHCIGAVHLHLYGRAANKAPHTFQNVACSSCSLHVGMRVQEELTGAFVRYKFISFRDSRGWVLRLAEPQAWVAMEHDVPPEPLRATAPRNLERAERSSHALPAAPGCMTPQAAVKATNALLQAGLESAYLRAVRANEAAGALGLHPKNAAARAHVAEHVTHGSKPTQSSQYTSLSEDPSVPLLWALPFGRVVVVAPALAKALAGGSPHAAEGDMFISNERLLQVLQEGGGQQEERALAYAQRSREALAVGSVAADAVDELLTHFRRLRQPVAVHPAESSADFPATVHDLARLQEAASDLPLPADMGASLLAFASQARPSYVVMRMSRNSLPGCSSAGAGSGSSGGSSSSSALAQALEGTIAQGRKQLLDAVDAYVREGLAARWPVAYYEADVAFLQPRVATDRIPAQGELEGLPFLLLRVPEEAGEWEAFAEGALRRLHSLKKGASA